MVGSLEKWVCICTQGTDMSLSVHKKHFCRPRLLLGVVLMLNMRVRDSATSVLLVYGHLKIVLLWQGLPTQAR